eukprot:4960774-Amphidinium_carterae.4
MLSACCLSGLSDLFCFDNSWRLWIRATLAQLAALALLHCAVGFTRRRCEPLFILSGRGTLDALRSDRTCLATTFQSPLVSVGLTGQDMSYQTAMKSVHCLPPPFAFATPMMAHSAALWHGLAWLLTHCNWLISAHSHLRVNGELVSAAMSLHDDDDLPDFDGDASQPEEEVHLEEPALLDQRGEPPAVSNEALELPLADTSATAAATNAAPGVTASLEPGTIGMWSGQHPSPSGQFWNSAR